MYSLGSFGISFMYGTKIIEKEFIWIGRKTIKGLFKNTYDYYLHTPYVKMGPIDSLNEAIAMKIMMDMYV